MNVRFRVVAVVASCVVCAAACGPSLRTVPLGAPPDVAAAPQLVDVPPPPAKVERIPPDPGKPCAWFDGRWEWVGEAWEWTAGGWVVPPPGCHFATAESGWAAGTDRSLLFYVPGRWYPDEGGKPCPEPRACGATTTEAPTAATPR